MGLFGGVFAGKAPPASITATPIQIEDNTDEDVQVHHDDCMQMQVRLKDKFVTCVNMEAQVDVPPHIVFDILADPYTHAKVFSAIKEAKAQLIEESGPKRTWHLDYKTYWKFWKVGGVCDQKVLMHTDKDAGTVSFKLREPGFLKVYEGTWQIKPADISLGRKEKQDTTADDADDDDLAVGKDQASSPFASITKSLPKLNVQSAVETSLRTIVTVEKMMAPKAQPPYPLNLALKGTAAKQVEEMVTNLFANARLNWPAANTAN